MIINPYLRKLMRTPFVTYFACDENGIHTQITHHECFQFPVDKDQRWAWYFDEKDPKNPSNIIVRLALTAEGKRVGNRSFADHRSDNRKAETENEFEIFSLDELFNVTDEGDKSVAREPIAPGSDPQDILEGKERKKAIWATLNELLPGNYPQLAYDVLVLNKTERELAPKYGCSPKTIGNRKHKIIEILRESELLKNFYNAL